MGIGKKEKTSPLQDAGKFVQQTLERDALRRMQREQEQAQANAQTVAPAKKVSEAKARKDRRPQQINTHFTAQEKKTIEDLLFKMRLRGVGQKDAATEEIVHVAVCHYLASVDNVDELRPEESKWWNKEFC